MSSYWLSDEFGAGAGGRAKGAEKGGCCLGASLLERGDLINITSV